MVCYKFYFLLSNQNFRILCKFFFYHCVEFGQIGIFVILSPNSASLVNFVIVLGVLQIFGVYLLEQYEKLPIYCEVLRFFFMKNQYSNSH